MTDRTLRAKLLKTIEIAFAPEARHLAAIFETSPVVFPVNPTHRAFIALFREKSKTRRGVKKDFYMNIPKQHAKVFD